MRYGLLSFSATPSSLFLFPCIIPGQPSPWLSNPGLGDDAPLGMNHALSHPNRSPVRNA